jgi:hypothetical protein
MFDFNYQSQAHQAACEERIQRALQNAERERYRARTPSLALSRRLLAQVGGVLIAIGTWLQTNESPNRATQLKKV